MDATACPTEPDESTADLPGVVIPFARRRPPVDQRREVTLTELVRDIDQIRDMLTALSAALAGYTASLTVLRSASTEPIPSRTGRATLTARERDIATLVGYGMTNGEIAAELFVSVKTVEYHLGRIYLKNDISNRRELRNLIRFGTARRDTAIQR